LGFPASLRKFSAIARNFPGGPAEFAARPVQGIRLKPLRLLRKTAFESPYRRSIRKKFPAKFPAGRERRRACIVTGFGLLVGLRILK
jgi:hypothetical protein